MNTSKLDRPPVRSLRSKEKSLLTPRTPADEARNALDTLFRQAVGIEWRSVWGRSDDLKPKRGGDSVAIREYARLICEHVERLNSLSESYCEQLRRVSRMRYTWPILKSEHPRLSEDEDKLIKLLQVGKGTGRYFDRFSKWDFQGKVALLVDELLYWVYACTNPPGCALYSPGNRNLVMTTGMGCLYVNDGTYCPHPILAQLCKHLAPRERSAAKLLPLSADSISNWEAFIISLFDDCFKDNESEQYLRQRFATDKLKDKPSRAKEYLIRKVLERLRTFAGIKRPILPCLHH